MTPPMILKGITFGTLATLGAVVVDETTHVPLGGALSVLVTSCGLVWWIGTKIQKNTDRIAELQEHVIGLNRRLDDLPCHRQDCPANQSPE